MRRAYQESALTIVDGAPIRWMASITARRRFSSATRVGSTDWIAALPPNRPARLFLYGASAASNSRAVENLREQLPSWSIEGIDGYRVSEEAVAAIQVFQPDLVLVGLGMPRQETFLLTNLHSLPVAVYATVGGAIDYIAGANKLAPRWIGRLGLEWLWRLCHEPRRLSSRYLIEPLRLLAHVALKRNPGS